MGIDLAGVFGIVTGRRISAQRTTGDRTALCARIPGDVAGVIAVDQTAGMLVGGLERFMLRVSPCDRCHGRRLHA